MVEVKKMKGKEMEVIKVKRSGKGPRLEGGEMDRWTEVMEMMVVEMQRIADGVEALVAGQQEIIAGIDGMVEEQRLIGFGVEVFRRKIEEGMAEKGKGKDKDKDKDKGKEKEKEMDTEKVMEETVMGEEDGDTDGDR